jgi:WD40 repeat protein
MRIPTTAAMLAAIPVLLAGQVNLQTFNPGAPKTVVTLETDKSQPSRLAWSSDGAQLYVQTFEGTFLELNQGTAKKIKHSVITVADASKKDVDAEPDWARQYWSVKAGKAAPDAAAFAIDVKEETKQQRAGSAPMGGDLAKGGVEGGDRSSAGGTSPGDVGSAAYASQRVIVRSMVLKGEIIGSFENTVIVPGLTFGWGPTGTRAIAFASPKNGRIVLMDEQGTKKEVAGSQDAVLPAWSPDGKKLAWLQKDGKKKYQLVVLTLEQ